MIKWTNDGVKLCLTIHYDKPSESGGMSSGCSMSFSAGLYSGYDEAHNECIRKAKEVFHLPELVLKPVPGSIQAMSNVQFRFVFALVAFAGVVGAGFGIFVGHQLIKVVNAHGGLTAVVSGWFL